MTQVSAPLHCFKAFGPGVYTYMIWVKHMQPAFLIAFLLAIPAAVYNTTGGELQSIGPWTSTTLGNVRSINASYGAIEVLVVLNFLVAMVRARDAVLREEASMRPYLQKLCVKLPSKLQRNHEVYTYTLIVDSPSWIHRLMLIIEAGDRQLFLR